MAFIDIDEDKEALYTHRELPQSEVLNFSSRSFKSPFSYGTNQFHIVVVVGWNALIASYHKTLISLTKPSVGFRSQITFE